VKEKISTTRRDAREWALQLLFQMDMNPLGSDPDAFNKMLENFWTDRSPSPKARTFTEGIVKGVKDNLEKIDDLVVKHAENWSLDRITIVDRNVLRMAIYEMLFCSEIPAAVVINEAVDISKYFGSSASGKFVNGILDKIRRERKQES